MLEVAISELGGAMLEKLSACLHCIAHYDREVGYWLLFLNLAATVCLLFMTWIRGCREY